MIRWQTHKNTKMTPLVWGLMMFILSTGTHHVGAQHPDYKINVRLDTASHTLEGKLTIHYTNRSDHPLDSIAIHVWMDAFENNQSALVRQMLHLGNLDLYRAPYSDRGSFLKLEFTSPSREITFNKDHQHNDIAWLKLSEPLAPKQEIVLSSPFKVKIPESFSRPGHTGTSYQLTQWYPHVAVLDEQGWHTMPYLDQGEFFNDFADYEVTIITPGEYNVAATGVLVSTNETGGMTTRMFQAKNVIDFAWFASPHFQYQEKMIEVGGDHPVHLQIYIDPFGNELWDSAMIYAERAVRFYSDWLGPYPYPQMSVVYTPFSSAGYMEYPMLAQISYAGDRQLLDRVITHEIGHTWIYGILASNERDHPWLDEGFNSFIENQYMQSNYPDAREMALPSVFHAKHSMDHFDALLHMVRAKGTLQPPSSSPGPQLSEQYLFSAYMLPAKGLELMHRQHGTAMMKKMFRQYYQDHRFTHVAPGDVRTSFEKACDCDLSWFFEEWISKSHDIDYRITQLDTRNDQVTIKNRSSSSLPLTITEFSNGEMVAQQWLPGFEKSTTLKIGTETDEIRLYDQFSPNKLWKADVAPKKMLPLITLIPKIGHPVRPSLSITPMFGYNRSDGFMPGITILSDLIPQPRFKFMITPLYGFDSKEWRGLAEARYITDVSGSLFDKLLLAMSGSTFGYDVDTHYLFRDHFIRFSPGIALRLKPKSIYTHNTSWLKYRYVDITQDYGLGIPDGFDERLYNRHQRHYGIHELLYQLSSDTVLKPFRASAAIQVGEGFVRMNLHYHQHFRGKDKMRGVWVHGFAGWLPYYEEPKANVALYFNGIASSGFSSKDYMYDEWLIGRNEISGNFSRQVFMKDAGLKTLSTIGISDKWMLGAGASVALPLKFIHVYMDAALYPSAITLETAMSFSSGISVILMKDVFEIYVPLFESRDIRESLSYVVRDDWFDRISFQANFKLANPISLLDRWQFRY